ncbi:MAG: MAPEG family protein [Paracoccaceae bacterium]
MMTPIGIALICVFVQVGLTFYAIVRMGKVRMASYKSKEYSMKDIALDSRNYPAHIQSIGNNVSNQFETPILFYAVVAIAAATDSTNWMLAAGSVIFVASRLAHHVVHVGSNVSKRFKAFLIGLIGLLLAWIGLGVALL